MESNEAWLSRLLSPNFYVAAQSIMTKKKKAIVRMSAPEQKRIWEVIFSRYPDKEWGTFIRLGWHDTPDGLVLSIKDVDLPTEGDLENETWITEIKTQYIRKMLRATEQHSFAVGFIHSHPEDFGTYPSGLDDDMESYISGLLKGYKSKEPFVSLIFSKSGNKISGSGRVYWNNTQFEITKFAIENVQVSLYNYENPSLLSENSLKRVKRLASMYSRNAAESLARSTVGIVGLSGTGSPTLEILVRAGVGKFILIEPESFDDSNLERVHGSTIDDIKANTLKAIIAKRHILSINPKANVIVIKGRIPQQKVVDKLLWSDIVVGCTDLHSSRVALNELSLRYLVPVIDVGVVMEGKDGNITGQVVQINRLFPGDPCVYCRNMINSKIASQELMTYEEQEKLKEEARKAKEKGQEPNNYWQDMPQLNTVGYLTTLAGSMMSGFIIGYLTGRFNMPKTRLELNLNPKATQIVECDARHCIDCMCQLIRGGADQDPMAILSSAPSHWAKPEIL